MRTRILYTLILIFCMSAFASSKNECAHPFRDNSPCTSSGKGQPSGETLKEVTKDIPDDEPGFRPQEFSTFQFAKFLYI